MIRQNLLSYLLYLSLQLVVAETMRNAKDRLGICGGLDKNDPHRLMYLNT